MFKLSTGVLMACCALPVQAQSGAPAHPATAKVGDVAVYEIDDRTERRKYDETVTTVAMEGDKLRTRHVRSDGTAPLEGVYGLDWSVHQSGTSGLKMSKPRRQVVLPLDVGLQWDDEYEGLVANGARIRAKMNSKVTAREKIVTPAGEFDAYRIDSSGYVNGVSFQGGFGVQQKTWFAPAIHRIVKTEFREQRARGVDYVSVLKTFQQAP